MFTLTAASITIHAREELAAGGLLLVFFVWTVTSLVWGFAGRRPKTHWTRQHARARRLAR